MSLPSQRPAREGLAVEDQGDADIPGRPLLRDVALGAGVSLRTASRVLNDDPRVAAATRARVQAVMAELRYTPDLMARSLRGGSDATIGLVVESVADPFFADLVDAVESAGSEMGRSVLVGSTRQVDERERRLVVEMLQRRVSGLLLVPTANNHDWLADVGTPVVAVDRAAPGLDVDVVGIDDRRASFEAVTHLLEHGHRRIACIGGSTQVATSVARLEGYRQALAEHDVAADESLVHPDCRTPRDAAVAMAELLARVDRCSSDAPRGAGGDGPLTAVFSAATACSLGVVPVLHSTGRTDLALVGFGDFAMADALVPAVTVVDHSGAAVGAAAVARLSARLADPGLPPARVDVPVHLVRRGSGELRP